MYVCAHCIVYKRLVFAHSYYFVAHCLNSAEFEFVRRDENWALCRRYRWSARCSLLMMMLLLLLIQTWTSVRQRADVNTAVSTPSAAFAVFVHSDTDCPRITEHAKVSDRVDRQWLRWLTTDLTNQRSKYATEDDDDDAQICKARPK